MYVKRMGGPWDPATITWNNRPTVGLHSDVTTVPQNPNWYITIDATTAVSEICDDHLNNYGIQVNSDNVFVGGYIKLYDEQHEWWYQPKLIITYYSTQGDYCGSTRNIGVNLPISVNTADFTDFYSGTCVDAFGPDVVYAFNATNGTTYFVDVVGDFDTVVYVRSSPCDDGDEKACNNDYGGDPNHSRVGFTANYSGTHYIFVDGRDEDSAGQCTINVTTCDGCYIGSTCYSNGTVNPENECQVCSPGFSRVEWYNMANIGCNDNNACTIGELCSDLGVCQGGASVICNDGNGCTDDYCDNGLGCIYTNNSDSCNDNIYCNGADTCGGGSCSVHAGDPCDDNGLYCDGTESCDEGNDKCVSSGDPCDDNGLYCDGTESCDEDNDECVSSGDPCDDNGLYCDGTESCDETNDECVSSGDPCDDNGLYCDGTESCDETNDECVSSGDPCGDNGFFCDGTESCDETNDECVSSGDPCDPLTETCNEETDTCDINPDDDDDDDNNPPTDDDNDDDDDDRDSGGGGGGGGGCGG